MKKIILKPAMEKKAKQKGSRAFYSILFLAIVSIGVSAYISSSRNKLEEELEKNSSTKAISASPDRTILKPITVPEEYSDAKTEPVSEEFWQSDDVIEISDDEVIEDAQTVTATPEITSMLMPADGEIIKPHSDTELVYSKTMEDWRLHKGVDIGAPIGTTVKAVADGTISKCYTDGALGVTVVIDHGNGMLSKYCNLASDRMAEVGQTIEAGTAIGVIGDTAEFETAEPAHLHFEIIKNGVCENPENYFN